MSGNEWCEIDKSVLADITVTAEMADLFDLSVMGAVRVQILAYKPCSGCPETKMSDILFVWETDDPRIAVNYNTYIDLPTRVLGALLEDAIRKDLDLHGLAVDLNDQMLDIYVARSKRQEGVFSPQYFEGNIKPPDLGL